MSGFRKFFTNRYLVSLTVFAALVNAAIWVLLRRTPEPQEELVPIHYNIYFGIDLVGEWKHLYALPVAGAVVWLCNTALAFLFMRKETVVAYFLVVSNLMLQGMLLFTTYLILTQI